MKKKSLLAFMAIAALLCACDDQTSEILAEENVETVITDEMQAQVQDVTDLLNSTSAVTRSGTTIEVEEIRPLYISDAEYEESKLLECNLKKDSIVGLVVNYKDDNGYVVMSNDQADPAIVTMARRGRVSPNGRVFSRSARSLVDPLIQSSRSGQDSGSRHGSRRNQFERRTEFDKWEIVKEVGPFLDDKDIHYHQHPPYNMFSPYMSSGPVIRNTYEERLVAGCAPIAYAQVMAYHEKPAINWDLAKSSNNGSEPIEVARLIREVGKELHAQYHSNGTFVCPYSARLLRSELRFANFLPYIDLTSDLLNDDMSLPFKKRDYSHPGKWQNYKLKNIISDLNKSRPVIVLAMSEGYKYIQHFKRKTFWTQGHYFVVDGYLTRRRIVRHYDGSKLYRKDVQEETLLHCNMGHLPELKEDGYYHSQLFNVSKKEPITRGVFGFVGKIGGHIVDFIKSGVEWSLDLASKGYDTPIPIGKTGRKNDYTHYLHTLSGVEP